MVLSIRKRVVVWLVKPITHALAVNEISRGWTPKPYSRKSSRTVQAVFSPCAFVVFFHHSVMAAMEVNGLSVANAWGGRAPAGFAAGLGVFCIYLSIDLKTAAA